MEEQLSAILRTLLERDRVSVGANFFDLGANSVQLVQLASALSLALDRRVSIVDVFRRPTIRTLASLFAEPAGAPDATPGAGERRGAARRAAREMSTTPKR